ncbi:unnamed protein product [Ceratitis capitata]|uniref:(Mediterranean fruit fly) hypothetical protein n=1 Tax=Ceratitis capitata TaxID=7213 RepID=A0A811VFE8_CERCA|nr:unnamed protein product [Ceratitis capitata]
MLKSKSFTLSSNTDKNQKGRDLLYEPRRIRWNRYLIAISLIGFSLLLILSNVNFSGDSYEMVVVPLIEIENQTAEVGTSTTSDSPGTITTVGGDTTEEGQSVGELGEDREEQEEKGSAVIGVLNIETAAAQIPITSFTCDDNRTCQTITCTGQPVNSIAIEQEFEYFIRYCGNKYFDVIIENCVFQKNTIDAYMFSGSFRLNTLTIRNCQLQTIADSAFDQTTMHKLLNLTFEGVQLKSLSEKTFSGLGTVQNFTLINQQQTANATLTASNFLQPMAVNLSMVILQQIQEQCNCQTIYNPTDWLGDDSDTLYAQLLFVDLSGTNFNHTLNNRTFSNLVAVQQLRLANCTLSVIGENVFTAIVQTLQYLDLRGNNLQRLDGEFLALATLNNVTIGMSSNLWRCCENTDLVYYLQQVEDQYARDVVCATPVELQGVQIRYAELNCSGR